RPERVRVGPEPTDLGAWDDAFRRAVRRERRRPVVLCVARAYPRKRLPDLLRAAALLRARIPDVQVRIVGRGPEYPALERAHAELALGDSAVLLGDVSRDDLAAGYVHPDLFCPPSVPEGFGIVFLEGTAPGRRGGGGRGGWGWWGGGGGGGGGGWATGPPGCWWPRATRRPSPAPSRRCSATGRARGRWAARDGGGPRPSPPTAWLAASWTR